MSTNDTLWIDQILRSFDRLQAAADELEQAACGVAKAECELEQLRLEFAKKERELEQKKRERERSNSTVARRQAEQDAVWAMSEDLVVLVRISTGAPRTIYHLADQPCGQAWGRGFRKMLEGQARASQLSRCRSCRWSVQDAALGSAA